MAGRRTKQLQQEHHRVERRRAASEVEARETQRKQAEAAMRLKYINRRRHHIASFVIWGVAVILAVSHFFEHLNLFQVMSAGLEDVLIGWPLAIMLALVGAIVWGRD
jgi:hypothetical protein